MNKNTISYIAHEAAIASFERQLKRQWVALIVAIVALIASNVAWFLCADGKDNHCCVCGARYDVGIPQSITMEVVCYGHKKKADSGVP